MVCTLSNGPPDFSLLAYDKPDRRRYLFFFFPPNARAELDQLEEATTGGVGADKEDESTVVWAMAPETFEACLPPTLDHAFRQNPVRFMHVFRCTRFESHRGHGMTA